VFVAYKSQDTSPLQLRLQLVQTFAQTMFSSILPENMMHKLIKYLLQSTIGLIVYDVDWDLQTTLSEIILNSLKINVTVLNVNLGTQS
jgi:hypothetical protein